MNHQHQARIWSTIALFIIVLVITMPFYSAKVLAASVQITRNSGQANIPQFIDAQNDVWTVQATITGGEETIDPTKVKLKIGNNQASFNSCTDSALGVMCEYISPLSDGVQEGEFGFQVVYNFMSPTGLPDAVSNGDVIKADGTGPKITFNHLQQNSQGQIELDFTVDEQVHSGAPTVGIKSITIVDADSGSTLQNINIAEQGIKKYDYVDDGDFSGVLQSTFTGEGQRRIKIKAQDWLGHNSVQDPIRSFASDFIAPVIKDQLNFTSLGQFIGLQAAPTDISVDIVEKNLQTVTAFSTQTDIGGAEADCALDEEIDDLWHCTWNDVEVAPDSSIAVTIAALDEFGNHAERTLTQSFTPDTSPPAMIFLGTERVFDDKSYVQKSGTHRIILKAQESGAGISAAGIRLNLLAFGRSSSEAPTACEQQDSGFECYWDISHTFSSAGVARIGLSTFKDNIGNEGETPEVELFIDDAGPAVQKIEVFGEGKDYFQSNDRLNIKFKAFESSGLTILVNVNDAVLDAENNFPETPFTRGMVPSTGWQVFTEDSCTKGESGIWGCTLETAPIKSGPETNVGVELRLQDTAGNDASSWPIEARNVQFRGTNNGPGKITFNLLGLSIEDAPDYWETGRVVPLTHIDLDTTELTYTRVPVRVSVQSDNAQANVLSMDVIECVPAEGSIAPEISRVAFTGNNFPEGQQSPASATLLFEFNPFNGRELFNVDETLGTFTEATASYTCQLRIFSRVGRDALSVGEIQEVQVNVPFAFSTLGAVDENLAKKVRELKGGSFKTLEVIGKINKVIDYIRWFATFASVIGSTIELVAFIADGFKVAAGNADKTGILGSFGPALRGACLASSNTDKLVEIAKWLEAPLQILSCNPTPGAFSLGGYGRYQNEVLESYNLLSGRDLLGIPASSLYENMYVSALGMCVPGILYNLQKYHEIQCRRIICYAREVPAGIATIEACDELYSLQVCEYFTGPVFDFIGLGAIAQIGRMLNAFLTSYLGLISVAEAAACSVFCFDPTPAPGLVTACKSAKVINMVLNIVDSTVSAIDRRPSLTSSPYCDIANDIDLDEVVGQVRPRGTATQAGAEEQVVSAEQPAQPNVPGQI